MNNQEKELINYNIRRYVEKNDARNKVRSNIRSKFPHLVKSNEPKLLSIVHANRSKFLELINNRDYYDKKGQQYLNGLLEESHANRINGDIIDVHPTFGKVETEPTTNSTTTSSTNSTPTAIDPRYITNRYHAEQYILNNILTNNSKKLKLKAVVDAHLAAQDQWERDRSIIDSKYNHEIGIQQAQLQDEESSQNTKLSNTKIEVIKHKINELNSEKDSALIEFDESVAFETKKLAFESIQLLSELNIPFFNTLHVYKYPDLPKDQEYLLQFIIKNLQ
ncbi:uncharacterized protein RJT21DRAFT_113492 [Scheffersomyces amazonensis]|uniref:uncharacterized protein n=1 Tax=Scheffersomyces amazonensis TaxID=1078765 RepID=UPI00315D6252